MEPRHQDKLRAAHKAAPLLPIKEHITRIRLSHAQMLLSNSDAKILSIAMDSGFGSLSSFYEAFQSHLDTTPSVFRRDARR